MHLIKELGPAFAKYLRERHRNRRPRGSYVMLALETEGTVNAFFILPDGTSEHFLTSTGRFRYLPDEHWLQYKDGPDLREGLNLYYLRQRG